MTSLPDLGRRMSKRIDQGKGMALTPGELVIFAESGALDVLKLIVASDEQPPVHIPGGFCTDCCDTFVYFIQQGSDGPVKIGYSRRPLNRLHTLQISFPVDLNMIALFQAPPSFESYLHQAFRLENLRGEWHHPTPRLLRYAADRGVVPFRKFRRGPAKRKAA